MPSTQHVKPTEPQAEGYVDLLHTSMTVLTAGACLKSELKFLLQAVKLAAHQLASVCLQIRIV